MPNPVLNVEYHGFSLTDHTGNLPLRLPTKQVKDVYEVANLSVGSSIIITYRDKLRDVLLENVPVQWGKKCIRYEETDDGVWVLFEDGSKEFCGILVGADGINSPVRKQKLPELQIFDYGSTMVIANVDAPKSLLDRLATKFNGKGIIQSVGLNGGTTVTIYRLVPENKNESYYRTTILFEYPSKLDDVEHDKVKVDDNDPASVVDHVKYMIRIIRHILAELWNCHYTKP